MKVYSCGAYNVNLIGEFDISPGANLCNANLSDANLRGANLPYSNLSGANLCNANLSDADLHDANLSGANLSDADLSGANLYCANLFRAGLRGADLSGANLQVANLSDADLRDADLSGVDLRGANLDDANLKDAKLPKFQIPQRKSLIVFKKLQDNRIAKLRIPCRAKRTASLIGNKCRAERAIVVDIYHSFDSNIKYQTGNSFYDFNFIYEVGKEVKPSREYDGDIREPCLSGIHFFMTEDEAKNYLY